jgi:hypothetical protein
MSRALAAFLFSCLALAACGTPAGIRHAEIPGLNGQTASFDQAIIDQSTHRLYLADGTLGSVDVFAVGSQPPRFLDSVKLGHAPHGLALAPDLHKVFAGIDGGAVAVVEADPGARNVNTVIASIPTSAKKNVDLVEYDPTSHVLWAASNSEGVLTKIDAIRNLAVSHLNLAAGLEQPRYDAADHHLYLPNLDKNLLYQVDTVKFAVSRQWELGVPCGPTGMGIDPKRNLAVLGCSDPAIAYTLEWDLSAGHRVRTFTEVGGADQVVYDQANDLYLVAGMSSGVTATGFFGGDPLAYRSVKLTHADTRAAAIDDASKVVYAPDAHPGESGLISFPLPGKESPAPPLVAPLVYLLPLILVGLAVWYYGGRRQRERTLAGRPMFS